MWVLMRRLMMCAMVAGIVGAGWYLRSDAFSRRWCALVMEQCAKRDLFLSLERLTLDPLEGFVARGIRIFHDRERRELLAEVDRLNLDLDYSKMLRRELFLDGMEVRQADVSFPLEPGEADAEVLRMSGMNARVLFVGDRVEVRQAEGSLFGVEVDLQGAVLRTRAKGERETDEERLNRQRRRMEAIRARRDLIVKVAEALKDFESDGPPRLEVEVTGDLEEPEEMTVSLRLKANGLRHGGYVCERLEAEASYAGETLDVSRLWVRDHLGEMEAAANWRLGEDHVDFQLHSTADLPGLLAAALRVEGVREVVFYEPVQVEAAGRLMLGKGMPEGAWLPVKGVASVRAGRFATRGKVLEGLRAEVGLSPEGVYVREGWLSHKTGTATFQGMWREGEGLKYRALLQMDPAVLLPFVQTQQTRETLQRFGFGEQSGIYFEVEGQGPSLDLAQCRSRGRYDLRHFLYRGIQVERLTGRMETEGLVQTFTELEVERTEGEATATLIRHDAAARKVTFEDLAGRLNPVEVVGAFAPKVAEVIRRYDLKGTPRLEMTGDIFYKSPGTDLTVKFRLPGGTGVYRLWDKDYVVQSPGGTLKFEEGGLRFALTGEVFGGGMSCAGVTSLRPGERDFEVRFKSAAFPYPVFGEQAPFREMSAAITSRGGKMDFAVDAGIFGGTLKVVGQADHGVAPVVFAGEMELNAVSFKQFASVYSPGNDTLGDVTGHMKFNGRLGDWKSLRGSGALTILNSNLYAVPILGPLTPLLGAVLPRPMKGYNEATSADCTFVVADGFARTDNIEALTAVFRLRSRGTVDFLENRIQFEAQANFRGLPGLVLFPVSEILEYVAEGSVGHPSWRPKYFSVSRQKEQFRRPDEVPTPAAAPTPARMEENIGRTGATAAEAEGRTRSRPASSSRNPGGAGRFNRPGNPVRIGK